MHSDWQSTEAFIYVIEKSNIMLTWTFKDIISYVLLYIHIIEIPTSKGANAYKL